MSAAASIHAAFQLEKVWPPYDFGTAAFATSAFITSFDVRFDFHAFCFFCFDETENEGKFLSLQRGRYAA